jgi:hypothetical protein
MIHLAAGEYRANLSATLPEMRLRVAELERGIEEQIRERGLEGKQAGADFFFALAFKGGTVDATPATHSDG